MSQRAAITFVMGIIVAGGLSAPRSGDVMATGGTDMLMVRVLPQQRPLRVGTLESSAFLGLEAGRSHGQFAMEGLSVDLRLMASSDDVLLAVAAGALDIGATNILSHIAARDRGDNLRAVAGATAEQRGRPVHGLLVAGRSSIHEARDLEGKRVGFSNVLGPDRVVTQHWLQDRGVDISSVSFIAMSPAQQSAALADGRVHAVSAEEPSLSLAVGQGARVLAYPYADSNQTTVLTYYVARGEWLSADPDVARRFARAVHASNAALETSPSLRQETAIAERGFTAELASRIQYPSYVSSVDPGAVAWWIDAGRRAGIIEHPLTVQELLFDSATIPTTPTPGTPVVPTPNPSPSVVLTPSPSPPVVGTMIPGG